MTPRNHKSVIITNSPPISLADWIGQKKKKKKNELFVYHKNGQTPEKKKCCKVHELKKFYTSSSCGEVRIRVPFFS